MALSPGGERVVSGSWDKTIRVWSLEDNECVATLEVGFGVLGPWGIAIAPMARVWGFGGLRYCPAASAWQRKT